MEQFAAVTTRYDKHDYIYDNTPAILEIVSWLRETAQEPLEADLADPDDLTHILHRSPR
ncbi:hypothetical protein IPZ68_30275 [Streptomyces arenae]|nr:hypothetical protein [Streptomyces arenae]